MYSINKKEYTIYQNLNIKLSKLIPKIKLHFKLPTRYNDHTRIDGKEFVNVLRAIC